MPFIAPFLPAIGKAAIGIGSSVLGSKIGKSTPSKLEQPVLDSTQANMQQARTLSDTAAGQSKSLFDMSMPAMQQPMNYWASILSGNKAGITSALSPEIMRIGQGYDSAARSTAALTPRGGPRADILADQPYQRQRDVSTLMQTARPAAASSLFGAGTQAAGQGGNLLSNAVQAIYGSTAAGREILNYELERRKRDTETGKSIGGSIFDILKNIDLSGLGKIGGKSPTLGKSGTGVDVLGGL